MTGPRKNIARADGLETAGTVQQQARIKRGGGHADGGYYIDTGYGYAPMADGGNGVSPPRMLAPGTRPTSRRLPHRRRTPAIVQAGPRTGRPAARA